MQRVGLLGDFHPGFYFIVGLVSLIDGKKLVRLEISSYHIYRINITKINEFQAIYWLLVLH